MRKEAVYTTPTNTLGALQDLIQALTERAGRDATIAAIEADIETTWEENRYLGTRTPNRYRGPIGIRVVEEDK